MPEIEPAITEVETQPEPDPIEVIYQGECESLSGRSTLTYAIGRHPDGSLHFRLVGNTGGGMFCNEWIPGADIDAVVIGHTELTSRPFQVLKSGRSINTGPFAMAAIKSLGLIRANAENSRHHEHVPTETFEKVVMAAIDPGSATKKPKAAKAKPKEAS